MGRILVTGAGGVLGTAVKKALKHSCRDFFAVDGRDDCDLEDKQSVSDLMKEASPDIVIHLAGSVYGVGGNMSFPSDIFAANTLINTNIVESSRRHGVKKFIGMGTTAMYADGLSQPFREIDVMVSQPHSSERFYAYAKRGMLMHLEACKLQYNMDFALLLSTNLYGPNDRFDEAHGHVIPSLISKFVKSAESGTPFSVWGDGSPTRDFLYSEDAADGIIRVMDTGTGVYNLASGRSISIRMLVDELHRLIPKASFHWDVSMPLGQLVRSYDIERIASLGFVPQWDIRKGLAATIDWYSSHRDGLRSSQTHSHA